MGQKEWGNEFVLDVLRVLAVLYGMAVDDGGCVCMCR
jgi:hypothetical protein